MAWFKGNIFCTRNTTSRLMQVNDMLSDSTSEDLSEYSLPKRNDVPRPLLLISEFSCAKASYLKIREERDQWKPSTWDCLVDKSKRTRICHSDLRLFSGKYRWLFRKMQFSLPQGSARHLLMIYSTSLSNRRTSERYQCLPQSLRV